MTTKEAQQLEDAIKNAFDRDNEYVHSVNFCFDNLIEEIRMLRLTLQEILQERN